jgi:hypothetical protein
MHAAHSDSKRVGLPFGDAAGEPPPPVPALGVVVVAGPRLATDGDFDAPHPDASNESAAAATTEVRMDETREDMTFRFCQEYRRGGNNTGSAVVTRL